MKLAISQFKITDKIGLFTNEGAKFADTKQLDVYAIHTAVTNRVLFTIGSSSKSYTKRTSFYNKFLQCKLNLKFLKHFSAAKKLNSCMTDLPTHFNPCFDIRSVPKKRQIVDKQINVALACA